MYGTLHRGSCRKTTLVPGFLQHPALSSLYVLVLNPGDFLLDDTAVDHTFQYCFIQ